MWKETYHVVAPGLPTSEILGPHTMGHHWKEFSLRELQHYFCLLSPDFNCVKGLYTMDEPEKSNALIKRIKWLRQGLHPEVDLMDKANGITLQPGC
jgi:2-polyprenyl-6-hydroxyphenyl methylase/3-demethylubiquinone-9 3-methyltransferase